jgi:hypothetical protein
MRWGHNDDDQTPFYTVHEQFASEPGQRLLGTPLSQHDTYAAAVEAAKSRSSDEPSKSYAVQYAGLVQWPA